MSTCKNARTNEQDLQDEQERRKTNTADIIFLNTQKKVAMPLSCVTITVWPSLEMVLPTPNTHARALGPLFFLFLLFFLFTQARTHTHTHTHTGPESPHRSFSFSLPSPLFLSSFSLTFSPSPLCCDNYNCCAPRPLANLFLYYYTSSYISRVEAKERVEAAKKILYDLPPY